MAKKYLVHIDLNKNELQNAVIQQLASAPSSPVQGQIYYNTGDDNIYIWDGAAWVDLTAGGLSDGDYGDITVSGSGAVLTIDNGVVSYAKLQDISATSRILGRITGGAGDAEELTAANVKTILALVAADISGFDTQVRTNRLDQMAAPSASVAFGSQKITGLADPTTAQEGATKNYVDNATQGLSWKTAVRAATTANGTLATAFENTDAIDGVTLATGDRILLKDQSAGAENGIYIVQASGAPVRATDANSATELRSATVYVEEGTANADTVWNQTTNAPITLDTTALVWAQVNGGTVPAASTTVAGRVELATQAETEAKSSGVLGIVPSGLANFPQRKIFTIGDGAATQIDVTHSLGTKEVITQVRQASDDVVVECDITNFSTSVVRLNFAVAPASNAIKVVVMG